MHLLQKYRNWAREIPEFTGEVIASTAYLFWLSCLAGTLIFFQHGLLVPMTLCLLTALTITVLIYAT